VKAADPPRFATWLLERVGSSYRREALAGDLVEEFQKGRSRFWFWRQVLQAIAFGLATHDDGRRVRSKTRSGLIRHYHEYRGLFLFLVLMFGFRSAWADWVYVPSGSMNPTILEGDRLFVDKHVYGLRVPFSLIHLTRGENPARGDIVVFDSPRDGKSLVKRLIALPGDTVALDGEQLIVNGAAAHYAAGEAFKLRTLLAATRAHDPSVLRESGVGPAHDILLLADRESDPSVEAMTVPEGMYFVLGDNRDNSADSRYIGLVPRRNIVGRATRVVVSLNPDRYYLPRSGRILRSLY
jgi:signal peptidase I